MNGSEMEVAQQNGLVRSQGGALAVEQQRAIAETQAAMVIARQFPRDVVSAIDRIVNQCARVALAETATYTYARGGTDISGPSIRLAETLAQNWGNMQYGVRELSQHNGESEVEVFAWDVEMNTRSSQTFTVKHERHTRSGVTKLTDPRDIYETVANQASRRLRARILAIIPADVRDAALEQCEVTLKSSITITPEYLKKMLEVAAGYGVTREMLEKRIQRRFDAITPAQVVQLRGIFNSLKDGMSSPSDWFSSETPVNDGDTPATRTQSVKDKMKASVKPADPFEEKKSDPISTESAVGARLDEMNGPDRAKWGQYIAKEFGKDWGVDQFTDAECQSLLAELDKAATAHQEALALA